MIVLNLGIFARRSAAVLVAIAAISTSATAANPVACVGQRPPVTPLDSAHLPTVAKLDALAPSNSGAKAVRSGDWSNPATWGGNVPSSGRVVIPAGLNVIFDVSNSPNFKSVRIDGCLELSSAASSRLNADFVYVAPKGELLAGLPNKPVPASVIAEIVFPDTGVIDTKADPGMFGKGLVAVSRVRLHGAPKTTRVKVAKAPMAGDQAVTLQATPAGWRAGDRIIIAGTRWIQQKTSNRVVLASPTEDEIRYVRSISGNVVTLDTPLVYDHKSPDQAVATYVVNYARNIRMATANGATLPAHRRAHSMYMSNETTIDGVEFFEMGRTDKSVRAHDLAELASTTSTTNLKGRYPAHLHQTGFVADDVAPVIQNSTVWSTPGWGMVQHGANAYFFDNAVWNAFGTGFVAESGNEMGAWVGNTAIKAIGVDVIIKEASNVFAFDLGRTGDGYWMQSRMIRMHKNVAAGMTGGFGYVFMHRGTDLNGKFPLQPDFMKATFCQYPSMRFTNQPIDRPQIVQFTDNEAFASEYGFHIVKNSPDEPHDVRSVLDRFTAWEVRNGMELTYTARYTVKNALLIASQTKPLTGVQFGRNAYDLALVNSKVVGFTTGVQLWPTSGRHIGPQSFFTLAGVTFSSIGGQTIANRDPKDQILATTPAPTPVKIAYKWGTGSPYINVAGAGSFLFIEGTKSDSSGTVIYPVKDEEFLFNRTQLIGLMDDRGWYTLPSKERAVVMPEFYSDRLTGELFQGSFIARLDSRISFPSKLNDGSPADQGSLDPKAAPPTAGADAASVAANGSVSIPVLSNDRSTDGKLVHAGYAFPREGRVQQLADGRLKYTPFPNFKGKDSFTYWVRNRQGLVSAAKVTVTVN